MRLLSISSLSTISLYLPTPSFDFVDPSNMRTRVTFSEPSKFFTKGKTYFFISFLGVINRTQKSFLNSSPATRKQWIKFTVWYKKRKKS